MVRTSLTLAAILATLLATVFSHPLPADSQGTEQAQKDKAALVEKLETDLVQAAALGGIADAMSMEQKFEEQILRVAVKTLMRDRGDPEKQARDMQALNELVRRDKRAVELLTGVLGSSSGGGEATAGGGGGGGLLSGLLGGSSGGGNTDGEGGDGGGGSNILSLLTGVLGSSSGGGGDSDDGGGGSNLLSLIPSLLGSSSGGGGDTGAEGGGGSNALSLITGILGSSSGGSSSGDAPSSGGGFKPLGNVLDQKLNLLNVGGGDDVLKGGTYDDLIGKSGSSNFVGAITNTVSSVLRAKFNIFKSLFSSLTGGLLGGVGGASGTA